jgi:hypothetical protein
MMFAPRYERRVPLASSKPEAVGVDEVAESRACLAIAAGHITDQRIDDRCRSVEKHVVCSNEERSALDAVSDDGMSVVRDGQDHRAREGGTKFAL